MASLEKLVVQLRQKKQEATKLRKKAEKQLKEVRSAERRSSSGLNTIDRKIESEREDISDVSTVLTQKTSQLESIERLVSAAQERLGREKEAIEQAHTNAAVQQMWIEYAEVCDYIPVGDVPEAKNLFSEFTPLQ